MLTRMSVLALTIGLVACGEGDEITRGGGTDTTRGGDTGQQGQRGAQLYSKDADISECNDSGVYCSEGQVCKLEVNVLEDNHYYCAKLILHNCEDSCGLYFGAGAACQCDDQCLENGDCCGGAWSYKSECGSSSSDSSSSKLTSCSGHCGDYLGSSASCNCDDGCAARGDCCGGSWSHQQLCGSSSSTKLSSCSGHCGDYLGSSASCNCDDGCAARGDCCGGSWSHQQLCGSSSNDGSAYCPSFGGDNSTSLGDLAGKSCSYWCWGNGTKYNICGSGKWQFCAPEGVFGDCTKH